MSTYKVSLLSEEHDIDTTIDCNDDVFVLDELTHQNPLTYLSYIVMKEWNMFSLFDMNMLAFVEFANKIEAFGEKFKVVKM